MFGFDSGVEVQEFKETGVRVGGVHPSKAGVQQGAIQERFRLYSRKIKRSGKYTMD